MKSLIEIIRELDKEFPMYYYPIYIKSTWSMVMINISTLKYIYCVTNLRPLELVKRKNLVLG